MCHASVPKPATLCAALGVWRSLVARSVRVGEVPSSNLGTPIERGGTHGSPACPLLCTAVLRTRAWAVLEQARLRPTGSNVLSRRPLRLQRPPRGSAGASCLVSFRPAGDAEESRFALCF